MMLRLMSDPRTAPVRELDLSGAVDGLAAVPVVAGLANRNLSFSRPDGGTNVVFRKRRAEVELSLNLAPGEAIRALHELAGLQAYDGQRALVMIAPNFDQSTVISAPLSRSVKAWRRDTTTRAFEIVDPTTLTINSTRYQIENDGTLSAVVGGTPRFDASFFARGLRVDGQKPNLISPSNPSTGSPLWFAGTGSPTVAFDPGLESVVRGHVGATKVVSTVSGPFGWVLGFAGAATANTRVHVGQWVRGSGGVSMAISEAAGGSTTTPTIILNPRRWSFVFDTLLTVGSSTSFLVTNTGFASLNGHAEFYQGPIYAFQSAPDAAIRGAQQWHENTTAKSEIVKIGPVRFPRSHTFAVRGTIPTSKLAFEPVLVGFEGGAGGVTEVHWTDTGPEFVTNGQKSNSVGLDSTTLEENRGRPFVYIERVDGGTQKCTLAIRKVDRSLARFSAPSKALQMTDTVADDVTTLRLGSAPSGSVGDRPASDCLLSDVRLDARPLTDTETERLEEFYITDEWSNLRFVTEGRLFEIVSVSPEQISGRWSDARSRVRFQEVDQIENGDLSFAV